MCQDVGRFGAASPHLEDRMRSGIGRIATIFVLGLTSGAVAAYAQAPAQAPPAAPSGIVVASPTYTSFTLEQDVSRPAADAWKRIGKYCDIGEWLRIPCTLTAGKDGEVGAVRSVANEVLVGRTDLS
jgi:hypothetical protein